MPKKSAAKPTDKHDQWEINRLKPHPKQDQVFTPPSEAEVARLAEDIERNGLQNPIEICRCGTVVRGHSRLKALTRLGWSKVPVILLDFQPDSQKCLDYLIEDNVVRRQLSPMEKARCAFAKLGQLEALQSAGASKRIKTQLKDRVAKELGMVRRNLDRYLKLLEAPAEVQNAVARQLLSQESAGKIVKLPEAEKRNVVKLINEHMNRLSAGNCDQLLDEVVRRFLKSKDITRRNHNSAMGKFTRALEAALADFGTDEAVNSLRPHYWGDKLPVVEQAVRLLERIAEQLSA
jgi:ParB family chromosome partitioning protein